MLCGIALLTVAPPVFGQEKAVRAPEPDSVTVQRFATEQDTSATAELAAPQDTARAHVGVAGEQRVDARPVLHGADQDTQAVSEDGVQRLEIDGLVMDETMTKLGRDFYDIFYSRWRAPEGAFNFTITVQEKPVPNLGTRITVKVNDEVAFQTQLQPRYEVVETAARQAVFFTARFLQNRAPSDFNY